MYNIVLPILCFARGGQGRVRIAYICIYVLTERGGKKAARTHCIIILCMYTLRRLCTHPRAARCLCLLAYSDGCLSLIVCQANGTFTNLFATPRRSSTWRPRTITLQYPIRPVATVPSPPRPRANTIICTITITTIITSSWPPGTPLPLPQPPLLLLLRPLPPPRQTCSTLQAVQLRRCTAVVRLQRLDLTSTVVALTLALTAVAATEEVSPSQS